MVYIHTAWKASGATLSRRRGVVYYFRHLLYQSADVIGRQGRLVAQH